MYNLDVASSRTLRGLVYLVVAAHVLVMHVSFKVPEWLVPAPQVDGEFPCMNHMCGCDSLDDCLEACCCYSDVERVNWLESHGKEVPSWLLAQATADSHDECSMCVAEGKTAPTRVFSPRTCKDLTQFFLAGIVVGVRADVLAGLNDGPAIDTLAVRPTTVPRALPLGTDPPPPKA